MFINRGGADIWNDLDYSISPNHSQIKILAFLKNNLPEVIQQLTVDSNIDLIAICEDDVSREIQRALNDKLRGSSSDYTFTFEARKGPDLLIYASPYQAFSKELFVIEAKRLRAKSRRDYVATGIGRFKEEVHGKQHDVAAMLGYVQEEDFNHWYGKVNGWINDLIPNADKELKWENQDKLKKVKVTDIGEYSSRHSRISKDPITLYHFWINLQTFS